MQATSDELKLINDGFLNGYKLIHLSDDWIHLTKDPIMVLLDRANELVYVHTPDLKDDNVDVQKYDLNEYTS